MKYLLLLLTTFLTLSGISQKKEIIGTWFWDKGDQYDIEVRYNNKKCQITALQKGGKSIISDNFFRYELRNDTIFYKRYISKKDSVLFTYFLSSVNDSILKTIDPNDGEHLLYSKVSSDLPDINPHKVNEFYHHNNTIVCVSDSLNIGYEHALSIGDININDGLDKVFENLGQPYQVQDGRDGIKNYIFLIDELESSVNYMVVSANNKEIQAIQFTGDSRNQKYAFSSIRLGDYANYVLQKLGKRYKEKQVSQINGVCWHYHPFPFSIELVNDRVYSIRINR